MPLTIVKMSVVQSDYSFFGMTIRLSPLQEMLMSTPFTYLFPVTSSVLSHLVYCKLCSYIYLSGRYPRVPQSFFVMIASYCDASEDGHICV